MKELREQIESIIRRNERLSRDMERVKNLTNGAIDFGSINDTPDLFIYKGIREIAELFDTEVMERDRETDEYPMEYSVKIGKTKLYMIE